LERKLEKILSDLEERLRYFSELELEFVLKKRGPLSLINLNEKILKCERCGLSLTRKNAVPGEGNPKAELMFVGEAPGRDEDFEGRPFVGKAGQLLTKIIKAMQLERSEVFITNVVKCRPPENRTPLKDEIERCKEYLLEQIEIIKPRVIIALGKVAADFFIPSEQGIMSLRGNFHEFRGIKVMPTFHPSYLIRNEGNKEIRKIVWEDMKKVMAFLSKK